MEQSDEKIVAVDTSKTVVKRARPVSWWMALPHTISIWWQLKMVGLRLRIVEWLGVDQLIRNEANARKQNDATNTQLINRVANQGNQIAHILPALVAVRKRLEFYEQDEILRYAKKRFDKANVKNKLQLEKINDRGTTERNGSRSGAANEVPEGPRLDAAREAGESGVQRTATDGAEVGRPEVQVDAATRDGIIRDAIADAEATSFTEAANQRTLVKCDLCDATDSRAKPGDPCPCGGGTYRLLLRATRTMTPGREGDNLP